MGIMQRVDEFFGVNPPSLKRRLGVSSFAITIVIISLIATIVGTNIAFGSKTFINSFIGFLTGASQVPGLTESQPYTTQRVVYFMGFIIVAFFLSIAYYIILPWKTAEEKSQPFVEEGLHKYYG